MADDQPALRRVFLTNTLESLLALIVEQGEEALRHSSIDFPARATPTILLVAKEGPLSAADIARKLGQPHQLVTQRIDLLTGLNIMVRVGDPKDARRKLLRITPKGKEQLYRLRDELARVEEIYKELFDEIDCDLAAKTQAAIEALKRRPLLERGKAVKGRAKRK